MKNIVSGLTSRTYWVCVRFFFFSSSGFTEQSLAIHSPGQLRCTKKTKAIKIDTFAGFGKYINSPPNSPYVYGGEAPLTPQPSPLPDARDSPSRVTNGTPNGMYM